MQPQLYAEMAQLESTHFWFKARREVLSCCLSRFLPAGSKRVVLDAGCGTGVNLGIFEKFGEIIGIDIFHDACLYAAGKRPGRFAQGNLKSLPVRETSVDVVALLDVLEHVDDQRDVLLELYRVLRPGGTLLITVPAFRHLWSGHDLSHQHRRRYRAAELRQELERAGFHIDYLSYYNTHLYLPVALSRLLRKHRANEQTTDMRIPPSWINSIFYTLFRAESLWIGRFSMPFGVSLVAVSEKIQLPDRTV